MNQHRMNHYLQQHPGAIEEGREHMQSVLSRSATDWEYRQRLIENPKAAITEVTGQALPASFEIAVVENEADATIVLPDPVHAEAELSEDELEAVAGGATPAALAIIASALAVYDAWFD